MLAISTQTHGANLMGLDILGRPNYGFGADAASVATQVEQSIADRVAAIRAKMIQLGIPVAVGTGVVTMLAFAGAFGLAKTERVWTPSIWLGALTTIGGLISVAVAAKTTAAAAPTAATPTTPAATPAAFGRYY